MLRFQTIVVLLIGGFLFTGCVMPSLYTVKPSEPDIRWESGIGFIDKQDQYISVCAGYVENRDGGFCFDVSVKNETDRTIVVDPALFHYDTYLLREEDTLNPSEFNKTLYAVDPERKIQQMDVELQKEDARYKSSVTLNALTGIVQIASDVAAIGKDETPEDQQAREQQRRENEEHYNAIGSDHIHNVESLQRTKEYWQTQFMRKTTLMPGQSIEGRVLYATQTKSPYLLLQFPIANTRVKMWFEQKEIRS
jgi:hypothetical protein